jgi:hypothetical protein
MKVIQYEVCQGDNKELNVLATSMKDICKEYGTSANYIREMQEFDIPEDVVLELAKQRKVDDKSLIIIMIGMLIIGIGIGFMIATTPMS